MALEETDKQSTAENKVKLELVKGYRFRVSFPDAEKTTLMMDEPPPLGEMKGPNAARVLAASIGNCLSASLIYCLSKSKIFVKNMKAEAEPIIARNNEGYWRVVRVEVSLFPEIEGVPDETRLKRCIDLFENYCVVTGAVRKGIDVNVNVNTHPRD
jgi:uncharacterized OsmC-like protein